MRKPLPGGYNGRILRVNLSNNTVSAEALDELFCRRYIGGAGFVAYYLWKELKQGVDALGPDNKLIFALGPVSGLQLPGAARHCVGSKSPLTGGIAKAEVGGFWAAELKRAGYDAIIIEGKANQPVYLWVQDGEASIRDASHLWGKETKETEEAIKAELGDKRIQLCTIGPAGENMVLYACIMHGLHDAAARGGNGAVMGSKNLKAIAIRGHKLPKIADGERVKEIRQQLIARPHMFSEFGTGAAEMMAFEKSGNLPIRNFRDGVFPEVEKINAIVMKDTLRIGMEGCYACPVRCKKVVQFEEPYRVDAAYGGPEYETIAVMGSNCGVGNLKAVAKANDRCCAYSLDTLSTGGTIAFAMECFEKGLLTTKDTGGIELRFGNDDALLKVIDLIARREGIGNLLAEGSARMAKKIGQGSEKFAMNVKGLECGLHDPRFMRPNLGLGFMINPNGADPGGGFGAGMMNSEDGVKMLHPLGIYEPVPPTDTGPRSVAMFILGQFKAYIEDSLTVCAFLPYSLQMEAELLAAVTGWDTSLPELAKTAERILTTARLFNVREGLTGADDELPERFYQPKTDGALSDKPLNRAEMAALKSMYYSLMGWDDQGIPVPEKAEALFIV
jgi:aldehyde:ferredoxin oxidoreductase